MIKMVEKWIHRECERDVADLVQPTEHRTGERCAVCGRTFGAVWLNEVTEAVSEPSKEVHTVGGNEFAEEPELEVIAVLEEVESIKETLDILEDEHYADLTPDLDAEAKKAEIARLKAQLEALEK